MSLSVNTIVERVRAVIDELMANDSSFLNQSTDEINLTDVIKDKIGYALQWLVEHAPVEKLDQENITGAGAYVPDTFSIDNTLMGQCQLPDDVLRVVSARLSSWRYAPLPVTEHSLEYLMQGDAYAKGSWDRPVVALVHRTGANGGERWLEFYSAKETTDTLHLLVFKKPSVNTSSGSNTVDVPSVLEGAFIYELAGLTLTTMKDERANAMFTIAEKFTS